MVLLLIPDFVSKMVIDRFLSDKGIYYSQEGEDLILERIFANQPTGFFVDVGAHHPTRFSNTYKLYLRGWKGINIDATPGSMSAFQTLRPRDTNLEIGVSDAASELTYFRFNEPALNTFSKARADLLLSTTVYTLAGTSRVQTNPLGEILKEHVPTGQTIDLLTIDVEGLDSVVLKTNDWDQFRPKVLLVEALENSLDKVLSSDVYLFLLSKKYSLFSKTFNTLIFIDSSSK